MFLHDWRFLSRGRRSVATSPNWSSLEPKGHVKPGQEHSMLRSQVECRVGPIAVVADLGSDLEVISEVVRQPNGMAAVSAREIRPLALLILPAFVEDGDKVTRRESKHGVVDRSVGQRGAWNIRANATSAA